MASGLSIVIDTRNAEQSIKNLHQQLERLENQGNSVANMMRGLGGVSAFGGLSSSINQLKTEFNSLATASNTTKTNLNGLNAELNQSKATFDTLATSVGNFRKAIQGIGTVLNNAQASMARFHQSSQSVITMLTAINGASGATGVNHLNTAIGALTPNVGALNTQLRTTNTALNAFATSANKAEASASKLNTVLSAMHTSTGGLGTSFNGLQSHISGLQSQLSGMGSSIVALNNNLQHLADHGNNAGRGLNGLNTNLNTSAGSASRAEGIFAGLNSTLGKLQALAGGGIMGMMGLSVAKTADEMQNLDSQIKLVTKSEAQYQAVRERVRKIADDNYSSISATTNLYQNTARAMANMGKSQEDVLTFTNAISLAMRTGGKSAHEQQAALLQLGQALQSGVLQGDEFRSISENAPILLDLIAEKLHKTRGEVKEMASDGDITAKIVVDAVSGATGKLQEMANKMPVTMSQAFEIVRNKYKEYIGDFMNGTDGVSSKIAGFVQSVALNFDSIAKVAVVGAGLAFIQLAGTIDVAAVAMTAFNAVMALNPLVLVTGAVLALGTAMYGVDDVFSTSKILIMDFVGVVGEGLRGLGTLVGKLAGDMASYFAESNAQSSKGFGVFFDNTQHGFLGMLQGIARILAAATATFNGFFIWMGNGFWQAVRAVDNAFIWMWNQIKFIADKIGSTMVDIINGAINGINGLINGANSILEKTPLTTRFTAVGTVQWNSSNVAPTPYLSITGKSLSENIGDSLAVTMPAVDGYFNGVNARRETTANDNAADKSRSNMLANLTTPMGKLQKAVEDNTDEQKKAKKEILKDARLVGISGNTGIGTGAHLHIQIKDGTRALTPEEIGRFAADGKPLTAYRKTSGYGHRHAPTAGASSFHRGFDYAMPVNTAITSKVPITDVQTYQGSAKSGYISLVTFADGLQVQLLHQSPDVMGIKGGISKGNSKLDSMLNQAHKSALKNGGGLLNGEKEVLDRAMQHATKYNYAGLEEQFGLQKGLLTAISSSESLAGKLMKSDAGALGEFQMMPATGKRFGLKNKDEFFDTGKQAIAAAKYLKYLSNLFNGDIDKIIMAYNAGEGNVQNGRAYKFKETQGYLKKNHRYLAYMGGGKEKTSTPNDFLEKEKKDYEEAQKLRIEYGTKEVQVHAQVAEKIKKIDANSQLTEPEKEEMRKKATAEGERELAEYKKGLDDKITALSQYKASELSLINKTRTDAIFNAEKEFKDNPQMLAQAKADIEAKWRYDIDQYQAKMQKQRNELYAFQKTERQVMVDGWADKLAEAELKTDEMKEMRLQALKEESERAIAIFDLEQNQKLLELNKFGITDLQYFEQSLKIKQELVDKSNLSPEMKNAQKAQNEREAWGGRYDTLKANGDAYNGMKAEMNGGKKWLDLEQQRQSRLEIIQKFYADEVTMSKQHYADLQAIDHDYAVQKQQILFEGYSSTFSALTGLMKAHAGEKSAIYRGMFYVEKAFNVASVILNNWGALSKAWNSAPFPSNLGAVAATAMQTGVMQAAIQAVSPKGFSSGGYTGGMATNAIAGVVHGQEYVVNASNTAKYRDKLEAMNRGTYQEGGHIQVNNFAGAKVETRQENGLTIFDIKNVVDDHMKSQMGNPNSTISKSIYRNTNARPQR